MFPILFTGLEVRLDWLWYLGIKELSFYERYIIKLDRLVKIQAALGLGRGSFPGEIIEKKIGVV